MSDSKSVKVIHALNIDKDNVNAGVYTLLDEIRPEWKRENTKIERFSEGYVNIMLCCQLESDFEKKDAIVVRIFGTLDPNYKYVMTRDQEVMSAQVAAAIKVGQPMYAIFENGVAYRYAPGRTLTGEDITNPEIIRLISLAAARIACTDLSTIDVFTADGKKRKMELLEASIYSQLDSAIFPMIPESLKDSKLNEIYKKELKSKDQMIAEFKRMKSHMDQNVPKVLCHNDFHIKNMVYHQQTAQLSILDYEGMGENYEGCDIIKNFMMAPSWSLLGWGKAKVFDETVLMPYVKIYLTEKNRLLGKRPDDISDNDINILFWYCQLNWIFAEYFLMMVWLMQIESRMSEKMDFRDKSPLQLAIDYYRRIEPRLDFFFNSKKPV